jgi:hypothetical protein
MKATLLAATDRQALRDRLRRLTPDTPSQWGTLTAPRMLCHLIDAFRVALGELPARDRSTFTSRTLLRWVAIETGLWAPPGKIRTAPEMLTSAPGDWSADLAACEACLALVGAGEASGRHPMFGPLSAREWGRLGWKHVDHHLRQFGQ